MTAIAPQSTGARGPIPFWAAAHEVVFDAFTSDTWTPGAATKNMFQGGLSQIKPYPFLKYLWIKITSSGGGGTGNVATDYPGSLIQLFRFQDPNGHAIIDTDGQGLWWLNKYGSHAWLGDPAKLPNFSSTAASPQVSFYVPFQFSTLGVGSLPNMDASGPYRIFFTGNTSAGIYSTNPATTIPLLTANVGLEAWSLPGPMSRVNGQPQVQAPPPLDRGVVLVREFTKQQFSIQSGGGLQTIRLTRVGNILMKLILVLRNSSSARIDWIANIASGSTVQIAFDTNPLRQIDPQHQIEMMMRRRSSGFSYDTGLLVIDFDTPHESGLQTDAFDANMDQALQTAQSSSIEITCNYASGAGSGTLEVYTLDVTATTVTGQPYSFAYAGQLLAPVPPGQIRS